VNNATKLLATRRIRGFVRASDPLTTTGIGSLRSGSPHCVLLPRNLTDNADVVVVGADAVTSNLVVMLRALAGRT
jgi:hypothetical protein